MERTSLQRFDPILPADPTVLHAAPRTPPRQVGQLLAFSTHNEQVGYAPRRAGVIAVVRVDPHEARLDVGRHPVRPRQVQRPNASAKPVFAGVRELDALLLALLIFQIRHWPGEVGKYTGLTEKQVTTTTGPKISSRTIFMLGFVLVKMVGEMK